MMNLIDAAWVCIFVLKMCGLITTPWWIILLPLVIIFIRCLFDSGK